ncbi:uncharacterized protein LOC128670160 [Plodia interpunctella]|uniref:uncharacterized protein LOC128670160 n=1 Tax=Plodia interpunctella TaxID=58824 RepID=UPI002367A388|nr:uncharacterized protein LOC128670160 [Plodia interpunctella]
MHCVKVLIICSLMSCVRSTYVGSTIFYKRRQDRSGDCWSLDDLSKLKARQLLETIMPIVPSTDKINKKYVRETVRYLRQALNEIDKDLDERTGGILKEALADAIGGHLRARVLPTIRFAYYAGYIPCKCARHAHDFFNDVKTELNTLGLGWADPRVPAHTNLSVVKILISTGKFVDPCTSLVSKRDANSCIHVPPPKLDDSKKPSAIALPFKKGGFISLTSPAAENILLNYYTTASRCILASSPAKCRHADFVNFNNEMWHWMKRDVAPHLVDEKLYCAYGGVFRIAAAVQSYGKGLKRRNLFEYDDPSSRWNIFRKFPGPCITVDMDWTPSLYIIVIFCLAATICFFQTMYYCLFKRRGCRCQGFTPSWHTKDLTYARVETNIPAMLAEHQSAIYYSDRKRGAKNSSKTRSTSLGSIKAQKVYDLNDNTEKMMAVIMSGNEDSDVESQSSAGSMMSKHESDGSPVSVLTKRSTQSTARSKSPPKLETPIAQLKLDSPVRTDKRPRQPMYTTSTVTRSELTFCPEQRDSESTWSDTSITDHSTSCSASFKSQSRQSSSTRNLAWARRIVSKHSGQTQTQTRSTTGTDFDFNSFTTPPSRR